MSARETVCAGLATAKCPKCYAQFNKININWAVKYGVDIETEFERGRVYEREECADLAQRLTSGTTQHIGDDIADAIRARGAK